MGQYVGNNRPENSFSILTVLTYLKQQPFDVLVTLRAGFDPVIPDTSFMTHNALYGMTLRLLEISSRATDMHTKQVDTIP